MGQHSGMDTPEGVEIVYVQLIISSIFYVTLFLYVS